MDRARAQEEHHRNCIENAMNNALLTVGNHLVQQQDHASALQNDVQASIAQQQEYALNLQNEVQAALMNMSLQQQTAHQEFRQFYQQMHDGRQNYPNIGTNENMGANTVRGFRPNREIKGRNKIRPRFHGELRR